MLKERSHNDSLILEMIEIGKWSLFILFNKLMVNTSIIHRSTIMSNQQHNQHQNQQNQQNQQQQQNQQNENQQQQQQPQSDQQKQQQQQNQ